MNEALEETPGLKVTGIMYNIYEDAVPITANEEDLQLLIAN